MGSRIPSRSPRRPDGDSLRITAKAVGDFSRTCATARGTRVVAEGPFGVFTREADRLEKSLLIAGGIGITPIRALLDELDGDVVVLYRVLKGERRDLPRRARRAALASRSSRAITTVEGNDLLSPGHLREMVPDIAERDVFVSGPPGMVNVIEKNVRQRGRAAPARPQRKVCALRTGGCP